MPLKDIFTKLSGQKKNQTRPEELTDITQLLDDRRLETRDPIIITVLGKVCCSSEMKENHSLALIVCYIIS